MHLPVIIRAVKFSVQFCILQHLIRLVLASCSECRCRISLVAGLGLSYLSISGQENRLMFTCFILMLNTDIHGIRNTLSVLLHGWKLSRSIYFNHVFYNNICILWQATHTYQSLRTPRCPFILYSLSLLPISRKLPTFTKFAFMRNAHVYMY